MTSPDTDHQHEPDADSFRPGEVWETPRGTLYRVEECRRGGKAVLRVGKSGGGRKVVRDWDAVIGWVRVSCPPIVSPSSSTAP